MNKKLVALAVAGALALPLAAQAQTANVTLYGRVHNDFEWVSGRQANGSNPKVFRINANSSRFGLRGTESLGGGLNAIFQIESSVSTDAGGGTLAGRETWVGLQGSWGTVKLGNFLYPYDDLHGIFGNTDLFLTTIVSAASIWAQANQGKTAGGFDTRSGNNISYEFPSMAGLSGRVQYGTFEGNPVQNSGVLGASLIYNNGPIQVGAAFERNEEVRGVGVDDLVWGIAAGYNFGFARLAGVYERMRYETTATGGGELKRNFYGVGVRVPLGVGSVYGFYGRAGDGKGSAATSVRIGGLTRGADTGADQWSISYQYPLSKRTFVYAGYHRISNECNASYTFNINAYAVGRPAGGCFGDPQGFIVGANHLF